jgi:hypothetical protein
MVSPTIMTEIKNLFEVLAEHSIDIHEYTGRMFDIVFEIVTADTFVAGIASKLINGHAVTPEERVFVASPMLIEGRWWRCEDGQSVDIGPYPKVRVVADAVEKLRRKCNEGLS